MLKNWIWLIVVTFLLFMHFGCRSLEQTPPDSTKLAPPTPKSSAAKTIPHIQPHVKPHIEPKRVVAPPVRKAPKIIPPTHITTTPKPKFDNSNVSLVKSGGSRFLSKDNFVTRWAVYGPFKFKHSLKQQTVLATIIHRPFVANEKRLSGASDNRQILLSNANDSKKFPGRINLAQIYPGVEYAAAYAVAYLDSEQAMSNLKLYCGSGGYIKIWLNGQLVHTYNRKNRDSHWDQDIINGIKLRKGRNQVVVKSVTLTKPWNFYFRLTNKADLPLTFTKPLK
jgi:hypothetical protein